MKDRSKEMERLENILKNAKEEALNNLVVAVADSNGWRDIKYVRECSENHFYQVRKYTDNLLDKEPKYTLKKQWY